MVSRIRIWLLLLLILGSLLLGACGGWPLAAPSPTGGMGPSPVPTGPRPDASPPAAGEVALPPPHLEGGMSLVEALAQRRSIRAYTDRPLSWEEISQLLWAAQGVTDPRGLRTAPSAGALYPLEVYLALPDGCYHYRPADHHLERLDDADLRQALWSAGLQQEALQEAPAIFVITAVIARTEAKYGDRAERYAYLEGGHAAQNLLLQATALGLGAVPIGAFDDAAVRQALGLPGSYTPLYLIPVGEPRLP